MRARYNNFNETKLENKMCAIITYDYPANTLNVLVYEIYLKMYKIEHKTYIQLIKNLYTVECTFFQIYKSSVQNLP